MQTITSKVAIIGCGYIGEHIIKHLKTEKSLHSDIVITRRTKDKGRAIAKKYNVTYLPDNPQGVQNADIIWLCIPPQQFPKVLNEIKPLVQENQTIISVAVAISHAYLKYRFPHNRIIRYMPTPLIFQKRGVALLAGDRLPHSWERVVRTWSTALLRVRDKDMHVYTTLASSASAFIPALFIKTMSTTPNPMLSKNELRRMLQIVGEDTFAAMREKTFARMKWIVQKAATPGGMTEAGLKMLDTPLFQKLVQQTIHATVERSKRLQKQYERK